MIVVKILGGLGNQMFQYAFFLLLSKKYNSVKLDCSEFENYDLHQGFELSRVFNVSIDDHNATKKEIEQLKDTTAYFKIRKMFGSIFLGNPNQFIKQTHYVQPNYSEFYLKIWSLSNMYLEGYWQNPKYLEEIKVEISEIFRWTNISERNHQFSLRMRAENSIAIHIRRLDKPNNFKQLLYRIRLQLFWRICNKKYYKKAISHFKNSIENPRFYVFTDNLEWSKRIFSTTNEYTIIDWNRGKESHWDMYLMTQCKHNIISMSSFSWWGAWQNSNPEKIVVAPKKWAVRFQKDKGIIPNDWIRI